MSRPKTKGEWGVATHRTIQAPARPRPVPEVNFDWGPKSVPMTITVGGNTYPYPGQPIINWTAVNQEVIFTADVRTPDDGFITTYEWDFGDGTTGFGNPIAHTFLTASPAARVILTVTDNFRRRFSQGQYMRLRSSQQTLLGGMTITDNPPV